MNGQRETPRRDDEDVTPVCHLASRTMYYSLTDIQRNRQRADKQRGDLYVILLKQVRCTYKVAQTDRPKNRCLWRKWLLHVNFIQEPQKGKIMPMQCIMHKFSSVPISVETKSCQERMLVATPTPICRKYWQLHKILWMQPETWGENSYFLSVFRLKANFI